MYVALSYDTIVSIWREQIGLVGYVQSLMFTYSQT